VCLLGKGEEMRKVAVAQVHVHQVPCNESHSSGSAPALPHVGKGVEEAGAGEDPEDELGGGQGGVRVQVQRSQAQERQDVFKVILMRSDGSVNLLTYPTSNPLLGNVFIVLNGDWVIVHHSGPYGEEGHHEGLEDEQGAVEGIHTKQLLVHAHIRLLL